MIALCKYYCLDFLLKHMYVHHSRYFTVMCIFPCNQSTWHLPDTSKGTNKHHRENFVVLNRVSYMWMNCSGGSRIFLGVGGRPPNPKVGLFCGLFAENYMKMRPLGSANELSKVFIYWQNHLLDDDICTGHFSLFYDMYYVIFCLILQYYLSHYTIKRSKGWKNSFIN